MGRGRNGVLIQTTRKDKRIKSGGKNRGFELFVMTKPLFTGKEERFFLEPSCIDYLRSLGPSEVASMLTN